MIKINQGNDPHVMRTISFQKGTITNMEFEKAKASLNQKIFVEDSQIYQENMMIHNSGNQMND